MADFGNVKIENNAPKALRELEGKEEEILQAIGLKWQSIVTKIITVKDIVDTGALRGSMTFKPFPKYVLVGTPKKYATKQEFENKKGPYMKPSLLDYKEVYKDIAEQILKR